MSETAVRLRRYLGSGCYTIHSLVAVGHKQWVRLSWTEGEPLSGHESLWLEVRDLQDRRILRDTWVEPFPSPATSPPPHPEVSARPIPLPELEPPLKQALLAHPAIATMWPYLASGRFLVSKVRISGSSGWARLDEWQPQPGEPNRSVLVLLRDATERAFAECCLSA